jgi:hypothetical protein
MASDKPVVELTEAGSSSGGGIARDTELTVQVTKAFFRDPIPLDDKIAALQDKLNFYALVKRNQIDLQKKITATYAEKPLAEILAELLPEIKVTFDGVDKGVTVENMTVENADLERVWDYLDDGAGVYFRYTETGLTVKPGPGQE